MLLEIGINYSNYVAVHSHSGAQRNHPATIQSNECCDHLKRGTHLKTPRVWVQRSGQAHTEHGQNPSTFWGTAIAIQVNGNKPECWQQWFDSVDFHHFPIQPGHDSWCKHKKPPALTFWDAISMRYWPVCGCQHLTTPLIPAVSTTAASHGPRYPR